MGRLVVVGGGVGLVVGGGGGCVVGGGLVVGGSVRRLVVSGRGGRWVVAVFNGRFLLPRLLPFFFLLFGLDCCCCCWLLLLLLLSSLSLSLFLMTRLPTTRSLLLLLSSPNLDEILRTSGNCFKNCSMLMPCLASSTTSRVAISSDWPSDENICWGTNFLGAKVCGRGF